MIGLVEIITVPAIAYNARGFRRRCSRRERPDNLRSYDVSGIKLQRIPNWALEFLGTEAGNSVRN